MDFIDNSDNFKLTPEQKQAQQAISDGVDIEMTVNTRGWALILDKFEDIKLEAENTALDQIPGDEKAIIAAHAVAYAVRQTYKSLLESVQDIRAERINALNFLEQSQEQELEQNENTQY